MVVRKKSSGNFLSFEEVNKKLAKGLEDIFASDRYKEMLEVMSKFRNYSLNNTIMIMTQKPQATRVKGFKQWKELGRNVNAGEKGITILAPMIGQREKIDEKTKKPILDSKGKPIKEKYLYGFRGVKVFDISQTNGKEIPSVRDFVNRELQDANSMKDFYNNFTEHIQKQGKYSVREDETEKGVGGFYNPTTNEIVVSNTENYNDTSKFRVLVHEYAHAKLHNLESPYKDLSRGHKEAQAESVAYVVSSYYGVETDDVSLGYIATWAKDPALAKQALNEIQDVSSEIIDVLDDLQIEKVNEFYQKDNEVYADVSEKIKERFNVDIDSVDKDETNIQFEVLQKDRGNILSGKLEFSDNNNKYHMRLNNNRVITLDEFSSEGNYAILNKEIDNQDIEVGDSYKSVADTFNITNKEDGNYIVTNNNIEISSPPFKTMNEAMNYKDRMEISQALHQQVFLKSQKETDPDKLNSVEQQINYTVGKHLSRKQNADFYPTGKDGSVIGWTLMKRPDIKTLHQLQKYTEETKHIPSNKSLVKAMENTEIKENNNGQEKERYSDKEMELT